MDIADKTTRATILVVDDMPDNLALMWGLFKDIYKVRVANSGEKALRIVASDPLPDLILLDVMMPKMDGYEVCRQLKANARTRNIPVIFLTAKADMEDERMGLELGAVDYIGKPISPTIVLARIKTHLALQAVAHFLGDKNAFLETEVTRRTLEVTAVQDVTIQALASLAETRDTETGNHILRTQNYVKVLAEKLRAHPRFANILTDSYILTLFKSAPLHDIGKVGIPDRILLKPGPLNAEEWTIMKTHTTLGLHTIQYLENSLGKRVEFLRMAGEIALSHQEKWDGSGYPEGLVGDAIPVSARLMALADVYDALISRRVYKEPMSHEKSIAIIVAGKGQHFDPDMVDAFMEIHEEFHAISTRLADSQLDIDKKKESLVRFAPPEEKSMVAISMGL